jgi:hypothetical protein
MVAGGAPGERRHQAVAALVSAATLVVFARGLLAGHSFFFRDLSGYFFPLRRFAALGLREGELRFWNPFIHEGEPMALLPIGYPPDLLQAWWPSAAFLSWLLALHVPLAAFGAFRLARHLGVGSVGASGAAIAFSLGGFTLSAVNLYVYLQALAWAPFVIHGLLEAARGGARDVVRAAILVGLAVSTTGAEIVAQTVVVGLALSLSRSAAAVKRLGGSLLLGASLAGFVALPLSALVGDSARGAGFATEVVVAHSVHPITLLQVLIAGLYADPSRFADTFWGQNYFPRGFPYFLSLYLGALAVGLAALGARLGLRATNVLAGAAVLGVVVSLGRYAGLAPVVDALPFLQQFRFPSKAFFLVHLAVALLAGFGIDALVRTDDARARRRAAFLLLGAGLLVALVPWLALRPTGWRVQLLAGFFPPELAWRAREAAAGVIARDAAAGGLLAIAAALAVLASARGLLPPARAGALLVALLGADLLRAGSGLNPMVAPSFYVPSGEARRVAEAVRSAGGRLLTLDASYSPAYFQARARRREHEAWSFAVFQDTLVPAFNLDLEVRTALSLDQTMLTPQASVLAPEDASRAALPRVLARARAAAVSHLLAVEPLSHPELEPVATLESPRLAPLRAFLYRLSGSLPRFEIEGGGSLHAALDRPGHIRLDVEAKDAGARVVVREAWSRGWSAWLDGRGLPLERHEGRYLAVRAPAGRHELELRYRAPGLRPGALVTALGAAAAGLLWRRAKRFDPEPPPPL